MPTVRIKKQLTIEVVGIQYVSEDELGESPDPYAELRAKIEALSEMLGCSEEDAERLLFNRLGHY